MLMDTHDLTLDDLLIRKRKMWQPRRGYRMGLDTVLLAAFVSPSPGEIVADLGTGAGAIPLLLTARFSGIKVYGVEIQEELVALAEKNISLNNLSAQVEVRHGDLTAMAEVWGQNRFHLVLSNPPYRKPGTGGKSPLQQKRIASEEIHCTLSRVVAAAARLVKPKGRVALVHKPERLPGLVEDFRSNNLQPIRLRFVHPRLKAAASLVLIEGEKQSNRQLTIESPLVIYENTGEYTRELNRIFYGEDGD